MPSEEQRLEAGIAALESQRAQLGDEVVDAALRGLQARLTALREITQEPAQALRQVSILFLDVVGSTSLGQHLDPEAIGSLMDGMLARGSAIVEAHRGRVLQYAGDNLLAAFGADVAAEDDAERAVRCGLALLDLGASLRSEVEVTHGLSGIGVRIGIHTGGVLLGGGVDKDGSIRGQAVNVAARMEQTAPPGALRISHDTYRQVRGVFDVEAQPRLAVKGIDVPVRSYLVLRAKPRAFRMATRGIEGVETRMIGRDAELAALQAAFVRLVESGAGLQRVLIVSEAGVGKSRLLYEFENWSESRPQRWLLFQARATPQMRAQPYGLVRDLFAWRWQILDGDSLDVARCKLENALLPLFAGNSEADAGAADDAESNVHLLGQLIGFGYDDSRHIRGIRDDPQQIRKRGFHAAAQVLRRLAQREGLPIVMLLDDLHWADDGSLDFMDHLSQVDRDVPMLIVSLTRPTLFERRGTAASMEGGAWSQRIDLQPLGVAESRRLASELLQKLADIPNELNDLLTSRASGNPFYMEELVKMLVDQGAITTMGDAWSLDADRLRTLRVPPTLTGVLQARLDGLPAPERHALQLASVIGMTFWDSALMHVDVEAPAHLPALRARALVEPKEGSEAVDHGIREHAFAHQILHQVTYDTVLRRIKQDAHARAAGWIARHTGILGKRLLAATAEHYERAGDAANAVEYYARAAAHMVETYAHDAAVEYSTHGLRLAAPDDAERRWRLLGYREQALQMLQRREAQRDDIDAMAALADAMPAGAAGDLSRAEVARRRSSLANRIGDWPSQEREARLAQALAERAGDEAVALRSVQRIVEALAYQGDPAAGRALAEPALARAKALGLDRVESGLLVAMSVCTDLLGDRLASLQQSVENLALNRRGVDRTNEAIALSNVGMSYLFFGAFPEAQRHLEEALRKHRTLGNREIEGNTLSTLSELAWRSGDAALALRHAQAGVDISREGGNRLYEADALWSLGNAELSLGRWEEADDAFARSCALAGEIRSIPQVLNALDGRARVALARADTVQAARLIEQLLQQATSPVPQNDRSAMSGGFPLNDDGRASHHNPFAGAYEQLIRLTMFRVWSSLGDSRAGPLLAEAYTRLMVEADRIRDADLRQRFLMHIAEHREIRAAASGAQLCDQ